HVAPCAGAGPRVRAALHALDQLHREASGRGARGDDGRARLAAAGRRLPLPDARHSPLGDTRVREQIAEIVAEAEAAFDGAAWPEHELDDEVLPFEHVGLYLGNAGMHWGLRRLGSTLDVPLDVELVRGNPSLLVGEAGVLLVTRADDTRLQELIDANAESGWNEILWGAPGTMIAARHAGLDASRSAEVLLGRQEADGLWTQDLDG